MDFASLESFIFSSCISFRDSLFIFLTAAGLRVCSCLSVCHCVHVLCTVCVSLYLCAEQSKYSSFIILVTCSANEGNPCYSSGTRDIVGGCPSKIQREKHLRSHTGSSPQSNSRLPTGLKQSKLPNLLNRQSYFLSHCA